METACRQLGFQGGSFYSWFNRQMPLESRLLYEEPKCKGNENSIFDCDWNSRQMGAGVCDYHPDLGIECLPQHENPIPYWRGIRFESAIYYKELTLHNTLYVPTSKSELKFVNLYYAGSGRYHNATSAIEVVGVPPLISYVDILNSAYNGINISNPEAPIFIRNSKIRNNRGHGIYINSSYGFSHIHKTVIVENGGDGIRYIHNEDRPDWRGEASDFCTLASVASQTYPVEVFAEQTIFPASEKICSKTFTTHYGHKITLNFLRAQTEKNESSLIEVYDGPSSRSRLILSFPIRNNTRPQSVISTLNQIHIRFKAEPSINSYIYMKLTSGLEKSFDLNVSFSDVSENEGRGIAFDNLRTQMHIYNTSISKNNYVAGVHVTNGVGDVNITQSQISFNDGDGVNITYTGGNRNISKSFINSNKRFGIAVWLNDTKETEYIMSNQTTVVQYSDIVNNLNTGILHGNYCGEALINVTGNYFEGNVGDALELLSCWFPSYSLNTLQIGHNTFTRNFKLGIKISPALNYQGKIEHNIFKNGIFGQLYIKNKPLEEFNVLKTNLVVQQNYFLGNKGIFVVNLGLSPYSETQYLLFTRNFVRDNIIIEPYQSEDGSVSKLNPRSRVAAPVVIASNNVDIFRNIIDNPYSKYELGSHFVDQSKDINCTFNWLGSNEDKLIFKRIFHRNDRYNLAQILFRPFLLHNSNPLTSRISSLHLYIPYFHQQNSNLVGGEVEGEESLQSGEYVVERDINIRPGGTLKLEPNVTLFFPPSVGMMVGGRLEARGVHPDSIRFTLKEEIVHPNEINDTDTNLYDTETESMYNSEPEVPVRLLGGSSITEGRLQVKINGTWGTVCNYGWTMKDAALVCQQLGLVLNPDDWFLERNEIPKAGKFKNNL